MYQPMLQRQGLMWSTLAMFCLAGGCSSSEIKLRSETPGQYVGLATALSMFGLLTDGRVEARAEATSPLLLLVGAPAATGVRTDTGVAYVYQKGDAAWSSIDSIYDAAATGREGFGQALCSKGNDVIVGAPLTSSFAGRAFVFAYAGGSWSQQGPLAATDAAANDGFGSAVAIDGNVALVGAPFEETGPDNTGSAYAFTRSGTTWSQSQKLIAAGLNQNDDFGSALLLEGTEALISSDDANPAYPLPSGGGRVHRWSLSAGVWSEGPTLRPSDPSYGKSFGQSLARQNQWLVVGAPGDSEAASQAGAVYVFERVGNDWVERQKLVANDPTTTANFGSSVAIDGNWIVVGARTANGVASQCGAAYVFELDGTWTFAGKLIAKDGATNDGFGACVAVRGNQVAVGAPFAADGEFQFSGAGYVFTIPQYFGTQRLLSEARRFAFRN